MPDATHVAAFALVSLGMALSPRPNAIYLTSRSLCQGSAAALVSVGGVALAFVFYVLCAAIGITAVLDAMPFAFDPLRWAGSTFLLYLGWQALRPGGYSPFLVRNMPKDSAGNLFATSFFTNLFNPKIAVMYFALLPQFVVPAQGDVFAQAVTLGLIQIAISIAVNATIALKAGSVAAFLTGRPVWAMLQRWVMGTVWCGLALSIAFEP